MRAPKPLCSYPPSSPGLFPNLADRQPQIGPEYTANHCIPIDNANCTIRPHGCHCGMTLSRGVADFFSRGGERLWSDYSYVSERQHGKPRNPEVGTGFALSMGGKRTRDTDGNTETTDRP